MCDLGGNFANLAGCHPERSEGSAVVELAKSRSLVALLLGMTTSAVT